MATTRRRFLQRAGAAAAALSVLSGADLFAASKKGSKMRFGLVTYQWGRKWDLPTLIEKCEASGVLGVELRTTHAHGVEPSLSAAERQEVKKRFEDSRVVCLGPGSNERFDSPDPKTLEKAIEATKGFLKLSHDIGASGVKVKPDRFHEGVEKKKTIEQIGRSLKELADFADDYGQEVRLEVHGQCSPLPIIKQIMDVADHPKAVVCWNSNGADLEGKGLEHNFDLVKDRFGRTAHVRELNLGSYPYEKLIGLFVNMDYNGWILLEARKDPKDPVKALIEQREVFERMVRKAQG